MASYFNGLGEPMTAEAFAAANPGLVPAPNFAPPVYAPWPELPPVRARPAAPLLPRPRRPVRQARRRILSRPVRRRLPARHPLRKPPVPAPNLPPAVQTLLSKLPGGSVAIAVDNMLSKAPLPVQIIAAPVFLGTGLVKGVIAGLNAALDGSVHYSAADIALEAQMKAGNLDPTARLVTRKASGDVVPRGGNVF